MGLRTKRLSFLVLTLLGLLCFQNLSAAEEEDEPESPVLRPKRIEKAPAPTPLPEVDDDSPPLKPLRIEKKSETGPYLKVRPRETTAPSPPQPFYDRFGVSLLYQTPLIHENTYDKRFTTFGLAVPVSVPLLSLSDSGMSLHVELGVSTTVSLLTFGTANTSFTHFYFSVPVRLRALFPVAPDFAVEALGGCQLRLFEYDSRNTLDGGFRAVGDLFGNIDPDLAVGVVYRLGESTRLRGFLGYLFLSAGIELAL